MQIISRQHLMGANRWFGGRTLAAVVAGLPEEPLPDPLLRTLLTAFEQLPLEKYLAGARERMQRAVPPGSSWERALIELAAELQYLSSEFRGAHTERRTSSSGIAQVALECQEFLLAEACLTAAVQTCTRLRQGGTLDLEKVYDDLDTRAGEVCLGGSTGRLVAAAQQRGIPAYRLDARSLVQLGEGVHQQRICTALTSRTSEIAVRVSSDKHFVNQLWTRIGIPVAAGRLVHDEDDAVRAAQEIGWPIVVKPVDADYSQGVSVNLRGVEQVRDAYPKARSRSASGRVLVERYLLGASHRLLIVDGKLAGAVRRDPISVRGDGRQNIRELVEQANREARWGLEHQVSIEEPEIAVLAEAGFTPESVPAPGIKVLLSHQQPESYGNVSEQVHPDTRELAIDAARVIGLDVAGLDVIALDISRPLAEQGGGFLEINAEPALYIHGDHDCDQPQAVGEAIVASLFPPPACGRVPLIVILGDHRADEVVHVAVELLHRGGTVVATSTPEQTCCKQRPLHPASPSPADRLAAMMLHPRTEIAILRAAFPEILQFGLGADQCDVLVLVDGPNEDTDAEACTELLDRLSAASRRWVVNREDPFWATIPASGASFASGVQALATAAVSVLRLDRATKSADIPH